MGGSVTGDGRGGDDRGDTSEGGHSTSEDGYECPFCGSTDTELESAFGSEVSAEQHYCHGCHTVFERVKYDGASADTGRGEPPGDGGAK